MSKENPGALRRFWRFLRKPFRMKDLEAAVRAELET